MVLPSVTLDCRVFTSPSNASHRILNLDISNDIPSEDYQSPYLPNLPSSSPPHLSHNSNAGMSKLSIDGIWMLGCGEYKQVNVDLTPEQQINTSERMSLCLPIEITSESHSALPNHLRDWYLGMDSSSTGISTNPNKASNPSLGKDTKDDGNDEQLAGHQCWLVPPRAEYDDLHLKVVERFLCDSLAANIFIRRLHSARCEKILNDEKAKAEGPRSITQVRKDREKEIANSGSSSKDGGDMVSISLEDDEDCVMESDQAEIERQKALNVNKKKFEASSVFSSSGPFIHLSPLLWSLLEAREGNITLVVLWSCLRNDQSLHYGMTPLHQVSLLSTWQSIRSVPWPLFTSNPLPFHNLHVNNSSGNAGNGLTICPADMLLVGVNYPRHVSVEWQDICTSVNAIVPITLSLRSVSSEPLIVSIEAVMKKDRDKDKERYSMDHHYGDIASEINGEISSLASVAKSSSKGLFWVGKCKYLCLTVKPFTSIQIPFVACITRLGIMDIKR